MFVLNRREYKAGYISFILYYKFIFFSKYGVILLIMHTKWWITKVKHPSLDTKKKHNISLVKINHTLLVLSTLIILSSSFVIYFICICHPGLQWFPVIIAILPV